MNSDIFDYNGDNGVQDTERENVLRRRMGMEQVKTFCELYTSLVITS